jgi:hypothetical protein
MRDVRSMISTLVVSLPAFRNVGALIGLLFFIYAYIGMMLLGSVQQAENNNDGLSYHANFYRTWIGALTLFRVATGDNWSVIFSGSTARPIGTCDSSLGNCASAALSIIYFVSFIIIMGNILMNIFTAVIIESFEKLQHQVSPFVGGTVRHLRPYPYMRLLGTILWKVQTLTQLLRQLHTHAITSLHEIVTFRRQLERRQHRRTNRTTATHGNLDPG